MNWYDGQGALSDSTVQIVLQRHFAGPVHRALTLKSMRIDIRQKVSAYACLDITVLPGVNTVTSEECEVAIGRDAWNQDTNGVNGASSE